MNTTALSLLQAALTCIVHADWQAAVLALAVLTACGLLGKSLQPRWRFALWMVVFARLALPIVPASSWSLFRLAPQPREERVVEESAVDAPAIEPMQDPEIRTLTDPPIPPLPSASPPTVESPPQPERIGVSSFFEKINELTPILWLAVALLLAGREMRLAIRLARQRRLWRQVSDPRIVRVSEECRQELGLTWPVELFLAPGWTGPATGGIWRPYIVLPETLVSSLSDEELRLVLLHELLHIRRIDVPSDRIAALITIVHWFNPIAWLALACLRRERELACDAAVLDRVETDEARSYGRLILKTAEQLRTPAPLPSAVEMFGANLSLARRIHMIVSHCKPTRTQRALGSLLVLLLIAVGLTDARIAGRGPDNDNKEGKKSQTAPDKLVPIAGICQDDAGAPLKDVRVTVYTEDYGLLKTERLREGTTDGRGEFRFADLPALPRSGERGTWITLTFTKKGRASVIWRISSETQADKIAVTMKPAATLQGRVTDPSGKAIAGAWVWIDGLLNDPLAGVRSSRTDADGHYAISDLAAWDVDTLKPTISADGRSGTTVIGCYFSIRHPDYGELRPMYKRVPDTINATLQPAGIIEGRVLDQIGGKPAANVLVCMQGTNKSMGGGWHQTRTDRAGNYRFSSLLAASYNIWADAPERACAAIDSLAVTAGKKHTAPDLTLVEGGWIEGRLIDAESGKPISRDPQSQQRLAVATYGPSRPKSGACCASSEVDDSGAFRLHVAPGINFPYIMYPDVWKRTQRCEFYKKGIEVKSGEIVTLEFRILPKEPLADPDPTPVRLQLPVAGERPAAERIRNLGGWHQVDKKNHIVEVNMVYHEEPGNRRYDNKRTDTDEALRAVKAFPHLKRLFLCKGQATDEALASVAGLKDLEVLFIWDADKITDAGVKHLAGLTKLQEVHLGNSQIDDGALELFARLPALKTLSLQGNAFSDEGLKHLEGMKQLRSLYVGMSRKPITDAGVKHLAGLTMLQHLDLQRAKISDEGVAALKSLPNLRSLSLGGDVRSGGKRITDSSVDILAAMTNMERLWLQGTRITDRGAKRLSELPRLKLLAISTSALPEQMREELQKRRPGLQLIPMGE